MDKAEKMSIDNYVLLDDKFNLNDNERFRIIIDLEEIKRGTIIRSLGKPIILVNPGKYAGTDDEFYSRKEIGMIGYVPNTKMIFYTENLRTSFIRLPKPLEELRSVEFIDDKELYSFLLVSPRAKDMLTKMQDLANAQTLESFAYEKKFF